MYCLAAPHSSRSHGVNSSITANNLIVNIEIVIAVYGIDDDGSKLWENFRIDSMERIQLRDGRINIDSVKPTFFKQVIYSIENGEDKVR